MKQVFESKFRIDEVVVIYPQYSEHIIGSKDNPISGTVIAIKFFRGIDTPTYSVLINGTETIRRYQEKDINTYIVTDRKQGITSEIKEVYTERTD